MANMNATVVFSVLTIFINICFVSALTDFEKNYKRTLLDIETNPDCNRTSSWCADSTKLTHLTAVGPSDQIHYVFGTYGAPTLMMSRIAGVKETNVTVDYDKMKNDKTGAVKFVSHGKTVTPEHSLGIVFAKLYEFDDFNDTANMTNYQGNHSAVAAHDLVELEWKFDEETSGGFHEFVLNATQGGNTNHTLFQNQSNSYISFRVRVDKEDGRLDTRPHMEHTANSSVIALVLGNLKTQFPNSRFAAELVMFTSSHINDSAVETNATDIQVEKSLDDEYSPGVFKMYNWRSNSSMPVEKAWGYAQWKPVMYTSTSRLNADLSHVNSYPNYNWSRQHILDNVLPNKSLVTFFFDLDNKDVSLNFTNVSFGQVNDKFYGNTKYVVWTLATGMGSAPSDGVSLLVILVIAVGLGIPLLLMIGSSVFVCVKNHKKKNQGYISINE